MQSRSYLFLLVVLILGGLSGWLYTAREPKLGLDISGGVRLTYQLNTKELKGQMTVGEAADRIITVLENRIQGLGGATEGTVSRKGTDQIIVEIPSITNIEEAKQRVGTSAKLFLYDAKNLVTEKFPNRPYREVEATDTKDPLVYFEKTYGSNTSQIIKPGDPEYKEIISSWVPILQGDELKDAGSEPSPDHPGQYIPSMHFSPEGTDKMSQWSRANYNSGEKLAYVLDDRVISVAPLAPGARITDGAIITGNFTPEYVKNLSDLLNGGALPVSLTELSSEKVDPTIGKQALGQIVTSGIAAFGITAIFLIGYYSFPGFVATIALLLYTLFTLSVLKLINATFSLAAIAGFILSLGMAVDANILVFERFKEEIKKGKTLHASIELGFKRALPAIIDSNMCTILTSLVLAQLGTGPVKGFATTLIIGVVISLFTAVTVTRSLMFFFIDSGIATNIKWYAVERNWFKKLEARADTDPLQVVQKSARWFAISIITVLITIPFFFMGGFKQNVEFRGGYEYAFKVSDSVATPQIVSNLERAGIKGANVKLSGEAGAKVAYLTIPTEAVKPGDQNADLTIAKDAGLGEIRAISSTHVGGTIQAETINNAIKAVIFSSLLIIVYLALRFGFSLGGFLPGLRFGISAVGALIHDIMVVIGIAAVVGYLLGWEISALFITAMLTVIGFSVHDTIVVFDRIRENLRRPEKGHDLAFVMNRSITQTFSRSVNTSMTVVVTLGILIAFGTATPDLKFFCVAMLVGIVSGTYSSIYNASPILYLYDKMLTRKDPHKGLVGLALDEAAKARIVGTSVAAPQAPATSAQGQPNQAGGNRSYGQVRRRASSKPGRIDIDDEP